MFRRLVWIIIVIIIIVINNTIAVLEGVKADEMVKVCKGTSLGYSRNANEDDKKRYKNLERIFKGCVYVETNLEIVAFQDVNENMTFDFLRSIKEVFGYVLIAMNSMTHLPLDNLQIVRGFHTRNMYSHDPSRNGSYSFMVEAFGDERTSLTIHMPLFREISSGHVSLRSVSRLCFLRTINWEDIFNDHHQQKVVRDDDDDDDDSSQEEDKCPSCHKSCSKGGCWGEKREMCQRYNRINCNSKCKNRCVIGHPEDCCDQECSVGCKSNLKSDCFACKNVNNNGTCEKECPRRFIHDHLTKMNKINPDGKYVYGQQCIAQCPRDMFVEGDSCVTMCSSGYKIEFDKSLCTRCFGDCPKSCKGQRRSLLLEDLKRFENCSIVHGSIYISDVSFNSENNSITMKDLKLLENVQLVTDSVHIRVNRSEFRSLNFLRNLRVIQGQEFHDYNATLVVLNTNLKELGLNSLKSVVRGNVIIHKNKDLCHVNGFKWENITSPNDKKSILYNKDPLACESEGRVCDGACSPEGGCMGPRKDQCMSCPGVTYNDLCLTSCQEFGASILLHQVDEKTCARCHKECAEGCDGPLPTQCWSCAKFRWNVSCVNECPAEMIHNLRNECVSQSQVALIGALSGVGGLLVITVLVVVVICHRNQMAKREEKKMMIAAQLTGVMECEPLKPTNIKPNMAQLKMIKESDLRCGGVVGSGAFGTVYKGLYIPEGEHVKIPVAIKVLQCEEEDENGRPLMEKDQEKQILDEAQIMASVVHPFCMHILAFCMGRRMMIISQFMPQGCLLEYVQNNKSKIGSKHILNWSSQIAKGMEYLEERNIIHRDLAARNVLVQTPNHVRITDFGLAKLVPDDDIYMSEGGKLPIKWLALECIQMKIFTHKSDIWSFGVTIWEICTFGQRPYENIPIEDFVIQLEKGERLPQPPICTIDVFMVMIKCWLVDSSSRPTFEELSKTFTEMAQDPGRFLVIENDEFKRISSETTDTTALLRSLNMGSREGLERFITADEYLKMKANDSSSSDKTSTDSDGSCHIAENNTRRGLKTLRNRPQVSLLINSGENVERGQSSSDSEPRYTPDPTSFQITKPFENASQNKEDSGSNENDNYLIPKSRGQPQYLELINECDSNGDLSHSSPKRNYTQNGGNSVTVVQNPEYFGNQI